MSLNIAVIGCGNIAESYLRNIAAHQELTVQGIFDLDSAKAEKMADAFNYPTYRSLESVLADDDVELVVNLTPPSAHYAVITAAIKAGRHVYSEKPLSLDLTEAQSMVDMAEKHGVGLYSAPITILGDAQVRAAEFIQDGGIGEPIFVIAEINNGFIENWHPEPEEFYRIGPVFDIGLYPLIHLIRTLGPIAEVHSLSAEVVPHRKALDGRTFSVEAPDYCTALLHFSSGCWGRLTTSFVVNDQSSRIGGIEYHGRDGVLTIDSPFLFDTSLRFKGIKDEEWTPITLENPYQGIDWARGLVHIENVLKKGARCNLPSETSIHALKVLHAIRNGGTKTII